MATSVVKRVKQLLSVEKDDFFKDDTVLFYVNRSQRQVVSSAVQRELRGTPIHDNEGRVVNLVSAKSLGVLDKLRRREELDLDAVTFTDSGRYHSGIVTVPAKANQFLYLRYKNRTPLRELTADELFQLDWGRIKPTEYESYYYVTTESKNISFEVYLSEDPTAGDNLNVFFVKQPTDIGMESVDLPELPVQVEGAVIYGAVVMMSLQENVRNPNSDVNTLNQIYQQKLNDALY